MFLRYLTVMGLLATVGKVTGNTTETTTLTPSTTPLIENTTSVSTTTTPVFSTPAPATGTTTLTTSTTQLIDSTTTVSTTTTPVSSITTPTPATGTTTLTTTTTPLIESTTTVSTTTTSVSSKTTPTPAKGATTLTSSTTPVTGITTSASSTTATTVSPITTPAPATGTTSLTPATKPPTGSTTNASTTTTTTTTTPVSITTAPVTVTSHTTGNTSLTSTTQPSTVLPTTSSTNTPTPFIGCPAIPCPPQSQCLGGVCLCISGTFLQNDQCIAAQVFPGKLRILSEFVPEMADRSSEIFQKTARNISDALFKALNGTQGYVRSDVVKLENGSVIATVNNIYQNTDITQEEIQGKIEKAAESNEFLNNATYNITDLCEVEPFPCNETSTTCSSTNGTVTCSCKEGYVPSPDSNNTCIENPTPVNPTIPEAPTLPPIIGCPANLCPPQSVCLDGVCLCISGTFLQNNQCISAQVFPGKLRILSEFVPEMADRSSEIFQKTARNISDALFKALNGTQGYVRSDVVKLENGSVIATVNNIYQNTDITQEEIQGKIEKAAESNEFLNNATYNITDLCEVEPFPCNETSTTCSSTNGTVTCSCKEGYVPSPDSNNTCIENPTPVNPTIPEAPTLPPIIGCPANLCPPQSVCLDGVCLCISGTFLQNNQCISAQVFPGKLRILSEFVPEMADRSSEIFQKTARNISDALFKALNGTQGYVRSDVVKLENGSVIATVNNIYQNTDITQEEIQGKIEKAAESNEFLNNATYNITDLCEVEPFPCNETSTTCSSTNGTVTCSCKEGYVPSPDSNNTCIENPTPVNPTIPEAPTLPPIIGCPANLCPPQSVCLDGVCLCISGTFLQNNQCISAQVFPGKLHLNSNFQAGMENRFSEIFRQMAQNISDALFKALYGTQGYVRSDVVKLENGSVIATVNNIYQNTDITEEEIQEQIEKEIERAAESNELLNNATYNSADLCEVEPFPCDETSTTCKSTNGSTTCFCKEGYIDIPYSDKSCIACPSGQRAVDNKCKPCPFGYSGFNCDDSSLLAVVVVSCVLGGILLIVLILFAYCFWKGPLKNSKSRSDYGINSYSSRFENQPLPAGFRKIPRATTKWDDDSVTEVSEDSGTYEQPR